MNIPRQFLGVNYLASLVETFQDNEYVDCPHIKCHEIDDIRAFDLLSKNTYELGLNAQCISQFLKNIITDKSCALDGIAICRGEHLLFSNYKTPFCADMPRITNSTCKTVVAIATMFAISDKLIQESDFVLSFFPEYDSMLTPRAVKNITISHLLSMTSCSKCNETISVTESNWVKAFLFSDCQEEPGSKFIYNSMNTYMLAAVLTKVTGVSLMDYLKKRFFEPLGINHIKWELCPMGIERGGWGLHISLQDMLKIGLFLANNGTYHNMQLLKPDFVKKIKTIHVSQDIDKLSTGYGYQIWHLPHGFYMLSGMYGQHVIIDDKHKLVIATNAHSDKMFPDSSLTKKIISFMTDSQLYHPAGRIKENMDYSILMRQICAFSKGIDITDISSIFSYQKVVSEYYKRQELDIIRLKAALKSFDRNKIHIDQTSIKLFPYMLQGMYQCPPFHVSDIAFCLKNNAIKICFFKEQPKKTATHPREKIIVTAGLVHYFYEEITIGNTKKQIATRIFLTHDEEKNDVLMLEIVFPSEGFIRIIKFFVFEDKLSIECVEYPNIYNITEQVLYGETILAGTRIDLSDKLPQGVKLFLNHKMEPQVNGYFYK